MFKSIWFEIVVWCDAIRLTILCSWDNYMVERKKKQDRVQNLQDLISSI